MSNHKWVCFNCRETVRRPGNAENVRCPACAQPCENIGYKIPVPPKYKPKLWQSLRECREKAAQNNVANVDQISVRQIHDLEQEIARISAMPENAGRRSLIKSLTKQLKAMQPEPIKQVN
jgi:DNA-directed RNA polymerase subunit RPC12/RpoP